MEENEIREEIENLKRSIDVVITYLSIITIILVSIIFIFFVNLNYT